MFKLILIVLLSFVTIDAGHVAYYNPDVMEQVVRIRQAGWTANPLPEEFPPVIGFVARQDCSKIGQLIWIFWGNGDFEGPFWVADCCNTIDGHCKKMKQRRIIVEIDYNTAKRRGILGYGSDYNSVWIISRKGP